MAAASDVLAFSALAIASVVALVRRRRVPSTVGGHDAAGDRQVVTPEDAMYVQRTMRLYQETPR
jgi:hypothetical protein